MQRQRAAPERKRTSSLKDLQRGMIVWFLRNLVDEFRIEDVVFFIENEDRAGENTGKWTVENEKAIGFSEIFVSHHR